MLMEMGKLILMNLWMDLIKCKNILIIFIIFIIVLSFEDDDNINNNF